MIGLLNDPQTSGGLLIAVAADRVDELIGALAAHGALAASVIGQTREHRDGEPWLVFRAV